MNRFVGTIFVALALIATTVFAKPASAQDPIYVSEATEAAASDIVTGIVVSTKSVVFDGQPHRVSEFEIIDSPKGELTGSILIEIPGGNFGDGRTVHYSHTPFLQLGDSVQLALIETPGNTGAGLSNASNPALTVYSIVDGEAGVREVLAPGVSRASASFSWSGIAWVNFDTPVPYKINPANSPLGETATIAAIRRGFQLWENDPNSFIDFEYAGTTSKSTWNSPGEIVVSFRYAPAGAGSDWLGQTATWPDSQGNLSEFDMELNRQTNWVNGAFFNRPDLGTAVAHEVGHGLGLFHTATVSDLMNERIPRGRVKPLGSGDRAAAAFLYGTQTLYCAGKVVTVNLNLGEIPTSGDDVILGTPGDDNIHARGGDDTVCAGYGKDTVHGGHGDDYIEGGRQGDYLYGDQGNDRILGESGNDRLFGDGGNDELFGNAGNDKLYGANGTDTLRGGDGRDALYGANDNDKLYGGNGDDRLYGESGNDRLYGDDGVDKLNGSNGDDMLYGGDDGDVLSGSRGDDLLEGGGGNDALDGGSHTDNCDGASGVDTAHRCEIRVSAS